MAEELARGHDDFAYANLAVRGRLLAQIVAEQVDAAIDLQPDLITLSPAATIVIRPSGDPDALAENLDAATGPLRAAGATVVLFTAPDIGTTPVIGSARGKAAIFNENVRTVAARHDAVIADSGHCASSRTHGCGLRTGCTFPRWGTTPSPPWSWTRSMSHNHEPPDPGAPAAHHGAQRAPRISSGPAILRPLGRAPAPPPLLRRRH